MLQVKAGARVLQCLDIIGMSEQSKLTVMTVNSLHANSRIIQVQLKASCYSSLKNGPNSQAPFEKAWSMCLSKHASAMHDCC